MENTPASPGEKKQLSLGVETSTPVIPSAPMVRLYSPVTPAAPEVPRGLVRKNRARAQQTRSPAIKAQNLGFR